MKDTLTSLNHVDFRQRYRGTYGLFAVGDKPKILVRLVEVDRERVTFEDARGGSYHVNADSGIPFEFFAVERQLFNTPDGILYCRRRPARQWSRGVSSANTLISNLNYGREVSVNFRSIEGLFNSQQNYSSYIDLLLKGKTNWAAFNKRFAALDGNVMMFDQKIGTIEGNTVTIEPLYAQEFSDLVKRNNLDIIVK